MGWIAVVMLFGFFIAIVPPFFGPPSLLAARGEPLRATVIGAEAPVEGEGELYYSLKTTGGIRIPGVLKAHDGYTVGSRVNVVVDPDGLVHPMLADDVRGWTWWPHYDRLGYETSWTCAGPFTSDDGKLRIERVVMEPDPRQRPDAPVVAKVAGAGSAVASTNSAWLGDFLVGLGVFAIGVWTAAVGAIAFLASISNASSST